MRRSPGLSPLPTDVNLTAPPPSTPPPSPFTLFEFYDLSRNRVSVSPYIGKIICMTFPMQNCTRFFANGFCTFFLFYRIPFFMKNLYFRILTRPCFIHIGKTLTSNPGLLTFTPAMPTIFANTANPVFIPVSIFHQTMVVELRGAGGQV